MNTDVTAFHYLKSRKMNIILLAFFSLVGCSFGVYISHLSDGYTFYLMRMAAASPVSIVGLTFVILLPFLSTAFTVWISKPLLLLPISFFNSFSFTFILCCTIASFGSAGWLVCVMLLFTNSTVHFCLFRIWIRCFNGSFRSCAEDLFRCFWYSLAISFVDYFFVAPYLVQLTSY